MNPTSSATQSIGEHLASHRQGSLQVFTIERESEGNQLTLGMISALAGAIRAAATLRDNRHAKPCKAALHTLKETAE